MIPLRKYEMIPPKVAPTGFKELIMSTSLGPNKAYQIGFLIQGVLFGVTAL